jgi:monoamine oxidase
VSVVFDNTSHDGAQPALATFAVGRGARELGAHPEPERRRQVIDVLVRCFGPEALAPVLYVDKDWSADPWARGCPTGIVPPGVMTTFGPALRRPVERIHWAGTETAREYTGYMEGAVESAERVVEEIAAAG